MRDLPFWWVMARASGVAAYLMISAGMIMGLALRVRIAPRALSGAAKVEWHRLLAFVGLAFTAVHGLALVADNHVSVSLLDLVAPGYIAYRPLWVAAGVLAAWLMVIVAVSASIRSDLGAKVWKRLHRASYGVFAAATAHGLMAGSDSGRGWMIGMYAGVSAVLVGLIVRRGLTTTSIGRSGTPRAVASPGDAAS